jgi:hypothetical protein
VLAYRQFFVLPPFKQINATVEISNNKSELFKTGLRRRPSTSGFMAYSFDGGTIPTVRRRRLVGFPLGLKYNLISAEFVRLRRQIQNEIKGTEADINSKNGGQTACTN